MQFLHSYDAVECEIASCKRWKHSAISLSSQGGGRHCTQPQPHKKQSLRTRHTSSSSVSTNWTGIIWPASNNAGPQQANQRRQQNDNIVEIPFLSCSSHQTRFKSMARVLRAARPDFPGWFTTTTSINITKLNGQNLPQQQWQQNYNINIYKLPD